MADGFVQVSPDQAGKRIANTAVTLPAGTVVVNGDGTSTALTSDTVVYVQRVELVDREGRPVDGATWGVELLAEVRALRELVGLAVDQM